MTLVSVDHIEDIDGLDLAPPLSLPPPRAGIGLQVSLDANYWILLEHAGGPHGTQSDQDVCWCHLLEQRGVPFVPKCPLWLEMDVMDVFG